MTPAQIAKIMALVDQYAATRNAGYIGSFGTPAEARAAVEAALSDAPRAGGWVMVPVEPTQTMMQQGKHALYEESMGDFDASLLEIKATYRAMLAARPSAPTAVEPDERTPQDYAIEHAEYMAQSAAHLIACVNDLALAEQQCEDGEANPSDVDAARESATEAQGHLKNSIYEFRKRRDRASKGTPK